MEASEQVSREVIEITFAFAHHQHRAFVDRTRSPLELSFTCPCFLCRLKLPQFRPDACHTNRYQAGTKLGIHQDRSEFDLFAPIISISLGLECIFLLGGFQRTDPTRRILLEHGDVIVWGGPSRMRFHGVLPVKPGHHPITGPYRYNLTFRKIA